MLRLVQRFSYWVHRRREAADLSDELEHHRAMLTDALGAAGARDPETESRRRMGNTVLEREEARAIWIWPWLESVWQDAGYAARAFRRQPGFVLLSVLVLGVAIGLNTSLFTVFAGAALRPMDGVADPTRVIVVSGRVPQVPNLLSGLSLPEFESLAAGATTAELAAERRSFTLDSDDGGIRTDAYFVTGNYFDLLGVSMERGRGFPAGEDEEVGSSSIVVLSHALWQTRYGGDPSIVGQSIRVADQPHTVIGVASRDFVGSEARIWLPIATMPVLRPNDFEISLDRPEACCVEVLGRLHSGVTREQAGVELQVLSDRFRATAGQDARPVVLGGTQALRGRRGDREALAVIGLLFLGNMLVLLLACTNLGTLLLARAAARRRELGVRLALGAGRSRVVRQLLTEGLILSLISAAAGLAVAAWLPRIVLNNVFGQAPSFNIDPDGLVFGYAAALAVLALLAFALAPSLHATRGDILTALKGTVFAPSRPRLRSLLLGTQVALTVVLLASAGLLLRGVAAAGELDLGFRVDEVTQVSVVLPQPGYDADRMRALLPELSAALQSSRLTPPFAFAAAGRAIEEARLPAELEQQSRPVERFDVSPSYFDMLDIPIMAGRSLAESDRNRGLTVVNETLARRLWPGEDPIGRSFVADGRTLEVIGVARDARLVGLDPPPPIFFQPLTGPRGALFPLVLIGSGEPSNAAAITEVIGRLEPRAQVTGTPMRSRFDDELAQLTLAPLTASTLGLFGLGLATVGMFSTFAYAVRQRTREIGVRIALGARWADILRCVLLGNARIVLLGLGAGVLGAVAASQLLRSQLFGLSPLDPLTYGGVALLLAAATMMASYVPARRALRVDAAATLRAD